MWGHVKWLMETIYRIIFQCRLCLQELVRNLVLSKDTSQEAYLLRKQKMTRQEKKTLKWKELGETKSDAKVSMSNCRSTSYVNLLTVHKDAFPNPWPNWLSVSQFLPRSLSLCLVFNLVYGYLHVIFSLSMSLYLSLYLNMQPVSWYVECLCFLCKKMMLGRFRWYDN